MVDFTLAFTALQTISITIGVIYHIMTLRSTQKTREPFLKAKEQIDTRLQDSRKKKGVFRYGREAIAWRAPPLFGQGPR